MEIDKNKPKTLVIRFNQETHKPAYIGTETPLKNGDAIITHIAGNPNLVWIPVPDEEEEEK